MKLPASNKTASYGKKPFIKKGYYPAKLLKVEEFADKDKNLVLGTYGNQLIFEFAVYAKDENDCPTVPMTFSEEGKETVDVKISKFVYHQYKDKANPGQFQTAITPNSAITKLLVALGWTFSEDGVDPDDFVGNWAEVNVNDFDTKTKEGEKYVASTIADVLPFKGEVSESVPEVEATKKPESVKKQVKHSENLPASDAPVKSSPVTEDDPEKLKAKINDLNNLHKDGHLTDNGHKSAVEQLQAKLDSLTKAE
jgi:hypothetical protein